MDTLEVWTVYSAGSFTNKNAERIVEKDWPFTLKTVGGDIFDEYLMDSLEIHNNRIWAYLDSNGYTDSKDKFQTDLLSEINRIKKAQETAESNKSVYDLLTRLQKNNRLNYTELIKIDDENYEFSVYSFDPENLDEKQILEMVFTVELRNEKVVIVE